MGYDETTRYMSKRWFKYTFGILHISKAFKYRDYLRNVILSMKCINTHFWCHFDKVSNRDNNKEIRFRKTLNQN